MATDFVSVVVILKRNCESTANILFRHWEQGIYFPKILLILF